MLLKTNSREIVKSIESYDDQEEVKFVAVDHNGNTLGEFENIHMAISFIHTQHGHDVDADDYGIVSYSQHHDMMNNYDIMGRRTD